MSKHKKKNVAPAYLDYPDEGLVEVTYPEGTVPGGGGEVKTMTFAAYLNTGTGISRAWKMTRDMYRRISSPSAVVVPIEPTPCETVRFLHIAAPSYSDTRWVEFSVDAKK